ncbi:hypothetical protein HZS_4541 [Henneguya salminicola]|nr:hypothetical protein HZS_4541 [Henneguya salminicola]
MTSRVTIKTLYCSCFTGYTIAEKLKRSGLAWCCLVCCYPNIATAALRNFTRVQRSISGDIVEDVIAGCYFPCCSLIQLERSRLM